MAKKKTSVVLPGGIAGLVHQVQRGGGEPARSEEQSEQAAPKEAVGEEAPKSEEPKGAIAAENAEKVAHETAPSESATTKKEQVSDEVPSAENAQQGGGEAAPVPEKRHRGRPAVPKQDVTPTEKAEREYHIVKDTGADSWDLFLDLGKIYKTRDQRLATIYIDPDLKRVLDRLKTASSVKLPTAAILSSIVARFIFDHEKKINDVIFGERLI